jgi:hypothetical protein
MRDASITELYIVDSSQLRLLSCSKQASMNFWCLGYHTAHIHDLGFIIYHSKLEKSVKLKSNI